MREIGCGDGMRWRVEAVAAAEEDGAAGAAGDADAPRVALLRCVTCEGEPRHVTIRAPRDEWREMSEADLCRLIAASSSTSFPDQPIHVTSPTCPAPWYGERLLRN